MKTKNTSLFLFALLIMSCTQKVKEERSEEIVADSTEVVVNNEHNAKNSLDYIGMYQGVVPCADCEGIETTLVLEDDKNYVLKTNYLGKKKNSTNEVRGVYSWNEAGNTIILSGMVKTPNQYFVGENYLKQLDVEGNTIEGELAEKYVLQKKSNVKVLPPPPPPAPIMIKDVSYHPKSLENTSLIKIKWRLIELNGKSVVNINDHNKEMFIQLNNDSRYSAFAGCNNMIGGFVLGDEKSLIKFTNGASTMMVCPDMTIEKEFSKMLVKISNYSINGNNLSLNGSEMAPLARFEAIK